MHSFGHSLMFFFVFVFLCQETLRLHSIISIPQNKYVSGYFREEGKAIAKEAASIIYFQVAILASKF